MTPTIGIIELLADERACTLWILQTERSHALLVHLERVLLELPLQIGTRWVIA